jgi:PiT family inorganic phosphate transporter
MAFGTALGGRPIVEKVGCELSELTPTEGLAADLGAGSVLLICSVIGLPVSTTHARVAAVCGAGKDPDLRILSQIGGAWLLTFPCCGLLSFLLTRLMT